MVMIMLEESFATNKEVVIKNPQRSSALVARQLLSHRL